MEYHAKSGASSLKIERVMLNLVLVRVSDTYHDHDLSSCDYTVQTCKCTSVRVWTIDRR